MKPLAPTVAALAASADCWNCPLACVAGLILTAVASPGGQLPVDEDRIPCAHCTTSVYWPLRPAGPPTVVNIAAKSRMSCFIPEFSFFPDVLCFCKPA